MQRWRYHSLLVRDLSIADARLNAEGERGWELVSMCMIDSNSARAYFKQPIEEGLAAVTTIDTSLEQSLQSAGPFG
jgi:hypothetical protein